MKNTFQDQSVGYDVAVFGAGPAGIAASVAAAREGARVVLVERMGYLGGNMASGLPFLAFFDMYKKRIVGGLAERMVEELARLNATSGHRYCPVHLSVTSIDPFLSRIICFKWAKEYGIDLLLHCEVSDARVEDGVLKQVTVTGKGQHINISADVFIDTTGDGDVGYLAGEEYELGQEGSHALQPPSLLFNLGGVDFDKVCDYIEEHPDEVTSNCNGRSHIQEGYNAEFLRGNDGHIFVGMRQLIQRLKAENKCPIDRDTIIYIRLPIPGQATINSIRVRDFNGVDIHSLSAGESYAHLQILPLVEMLREYVPGFENCYITSVNPSIGVRETRRLCGIRTLTEDDCISGHIPDDSIAIYSYFIDRHSSTDSHTYTQSIKKPYGVPYGCTVAKSIDGLMMAGRCISQDSTALATSRIMTLCMAVGEAAGVGAALASKEKIGPRDVDVSEVRRIHSKNGAILTWSEN